MKIWLLRCNIMTAKKWNLLEMKWLIITSLTSDWSLLWSHRLKQLYVPFFVSTYLNGFSFIHQNCLTRVLLDCFNLLYFSSFKAGIANAISSFK